MIKKDIEDEKLNFLGEKFSFRVASVAMEISI
jgi:hypothetical protein